MDEKMKLLRNVLIYLEENYESEYLSEMFCISEVDFNFELPNEEILQNSEIESESLFDILDSFDTPSGVKPLRECRAHRPRKRDLSELSKKLETTWASDLFMIIDDNGYKDSEVYKRAGVSKQTFSKIRNDLYYQPKRDTAIQLCIGLMLNIDQSIDLLLKAGFGLSNSSKRDLVVRYFIENSIYDIYELNDILYELNLELFSIS